MELLKIVAFAVVAAVLCLVLKNYRPEFSVLLNIATSVVILLLLAATLEVILKETEGLIAFSGIDRSYFEILLKCIGVAYLTSFASDIIEDAGERSISAKVELSGRVIILYLSLPVFLNLLKVVGALI